MKDKATSALPGPTDGQALPSVTEGTTELLKDPISRVSG